MTEAIRKYIKAKGGLKTPSLNYIILADGTLSRNVVDTTRQRKSWSERGVAKNFKTQQL